MIRKLAICVVFQCVVLAQQSDVEKAFAEYQQAWATADKNAIAKLAADDLVWITRSGKAFSKTEFLGVFNPRTGTKNIRDMQVRVFGNVAVMTYAGDEGSSAIRRTIVWNQTGEGWKMVSVQATMISK